MLRNRGVVFQDLTPVCYPLGVIERYRAVEVLYHSYLTGLILTTARRRLDQGDACFEWRVRPKSS